MAGGPAQVTDRTLRFSPEELTRIRECARALGTSYVEFIHTATMQAVDECEGLDRDRIAELHREAARS
jgi:hypothetical protein